MKKPTHSQSHFSAAMKVEELIIDGFKSYATRTVISDWDPQFNAITGLNGSGKSNILDAICFVLGISSMATVRASNLQDLIYKRGQAGVTKASVTIVFDNSDKANSPIGFTNSPKISVTRQIVLGGTSKYLINGHRTPQQSVLQLFQSVQLNVNNPNFLIMQGQITKVLNMRPTEVLSLIEEAAGTRMFEDRREKAERTMAKKEIKLQENRTLLAEEIEPKLSKFRNERRLFLEFQTTQSDLEKTTKVVTAFTYHNTKSRHTSMKETVKSSEDRISDLKELVARTTKEINSLNEDLEELISRKKEEFDKNGKLDELQRQENDLLSRLSRAKTSFKICCDNIAENVNKNQSIKANIEAWRRDLGSKEVDYRQAKTQYEETDHKLKNLKKQFAKKSELYSTLSTGISSSGVSDVGFSAQISAAKNELNDAQVDARKLGMRIEMMEKELAMNESNMHSAQEEMERSNLHTAECKRVCEKLEEELSKAGYSESYLKELKVRQKDIKQELYNLSKEKETLRRCVGNIEFQYTKPSPDFNDASVKGVAARLFSLKEEHYDSATALQVCAGGRLFNVVVDNDHSAAQLLEKGRLRKRVTIIPLNKVHSRVLSQDVLSAAKQIAPGKVELALNLITYDKSVSSAMQFIFGTSLICKDAETAKKVTFHPKVRARCITLDGDVYEPEGTLSGGSRNVSNTLLIDIQKFNGITRKIKQLEVELNSIQAKIMDQDIIFKKTKDIQSKLSLARHKLKLAEKNSGPNLASQLLKRNEELRRSITSANEDLVKKQEEVKTLQKEVKRLEVDSEEFDKDKGGKLKELKLQIDSYNKAIKQLEETLEAKYDEYQNLQLENDQLRNEIKSSTETCHQIEDILSELQGQKSELESNIDSVKEQLTSVQEALSQEKDRMLSMDEEIKELEALIQVKHDSMNTNELELQKLQHELEDLKSSTDALQRKLEEMEEAHHWVADEDVINAMVQQYEGINIREYRERAKRLQEKFNELKRKVNPNTMNMIESIEKKESALKTMIKTIEKDKIKIQKTIFKLDEYKRDALHKTWEKVSDDFGRIFGDLLPNAFAKLVLADESDITKGLEVKVKLGNMWKESLNELSGGQRSLIALSLIMALLQFRPAPVYILDEVDAALDLSHTQNIGHLIRTRFRGSQFIVVSLKEGMFSNANKIFRVRFQAGTSVVNVM